jgi:hypothetical protein
MELGSQPENGKRQGCMTAALTVGVHFNPIEMAFSKLKALLRKAAERTVEGLWDAIGRLVDLVTPAESANFFTAAGYEPE